MVLALLSPVDVPYSSFIMESPTSYLSDDLTTFSAWESENHFDGYSNGGAYSLAFQPHEEESWGSPDSSVQLSTAVNKQLIFPSYEIGSSGWQLKSIEKWTPENTIDWAFQVAQENNVVCEDLHNFGGVDGQRLLTMNETEFIALEPQCGSLLYSALQNLKCKYGIVSTGDELSNSIEHSGLSQRESQEEHETAQPKIKRSPGRPRLPGRRNKKPEARTGKLWEFIRDLLLKPEYCPSLICWEDHDEGIFRFVHSEQVAKLWGTRKENDKMTYEKLSRAMRYYYKSKVLQPVLGRRLVYKFGPGATGWRTENPNFKNEEYAKSKL